MQVQNRRHFNSVSSVEGALDFPGLIKPNSKNLRSHTIGRSNYIKKLDLLEHKCYHGTYVLYPIRKGPFMSTSDQFFIGLKAYQEIQAELKQQDKQELVVSRTRGQERNGEEPLLLSGGSLLLGFAEDGLPLILDLYDPTPGPLLVAGDGGSGKTAVLQSIARTSGLLDPGDIQFGVITPFPEEWAGLDDLPHGLGIWPAYHPSAHHFLSQLHQWAESWPLTRQAVLLLLDGLDLLTGHSFHLQQELCWLLANGPERHIWPIVSTNPAHLSHMLNWLDYFHTRILGRVKYNHNTRLLLENPQVNLTDLVPGIQFAFSQPEGLLRFLLPPLT